VKSTSGGPKPSNWTANTLTSATSNRLDNADHVYGRSGKGTGVPDNAK
jgi:hypothetical protein